VKEDGYEENPPVITVVFIKFLVPVIVVKFLNEGSQHASAGEEYQQSEDYVGYPEHKN